MHIYAYYIYIYRCRFKQQQVNIAKCTAEGLAPTPTDECFTTFVQEKIIKLNEALYQSHEQTQSSIIFTPDHEAIDNVRNKILKR